MRKSRPAKLPCVTLSLLAIVFVLFANAHAANADDLLSLPVELGPMTGTASENRVLTFNAAARTKMKLHDAQDDAEHSVRGVPLRELVAQIKPPKAADTLVFKFANGMQVPVRLSDKAALRDLFIAFEHGDALGNYTTVYPMGAGLPKVPCPKVVFQKTGTDYNIWRYTDRLTSVQVATWAGLEATLAQPSRQLPVSAGWKLYERHCQACHGMGGQGAKRGPDFISDLEAYRRVPPLSVSETGQLPSLHDKVTGRASGGMPTLDHISNGEIVELWRWLHAVHKGATK